MRSKSIQVVSYSDISLLDLAGPLDIFLAAYKFSPVGKPPYSVSVISLKDKAKVFPSLSLNTSLLGVETLSDAPEMSSETKNYSIRL